MLKRIFPFIALVGFVVLLDPTPTPAQPGRGKGGGDSGNGPGGFGFGRRPEGGGPGGGGPPGGGFSFRTGGSGDSPGGGPPGGFGIVGPTGGGPPGGFGGFGMGGPGGGGPPGGFGMGGPGGGGPPGGFGGFGMGRGRGISPEQGWQGLQFLTGSSGDTVDLGKIPPQTRAMLNGITERMGGLPLPESGIMTKDQYMDFFARSEAARMARTESGGGGDRGRAPGGFDSGSWGQGGWGGWGQGGWGGWGDQNRDNRDNRNSDRRQPTDEERPIAMRYGKLPQGLPGWFNELDVDKDGQVGLYEWRKAGKDLKEFMEMDLNGDGLVTADEYLRFARLKNIETKVAAYESGEREPGNWGLGEKLDGSGGSNSKGGWGPPGGFGGFGGFGPPGGGFGGWGSSGWEKGPKGEKGEKGEKERGDKGSKGNPWQPRR